MNLSEPRPGQRRSQYHFRDFVLDVDGGFLRRGGEEVPLQPKAFEVLSYLAERHGFLVSKGELIDAVWGRPQSRTIRSHSAWCKSAGR
jgi:DNA-binding winged helix-turn-helix (wHTH) protein